MTTHRRWRYELLPIIFAIAVIPLVVHLKILPLTGESLNVWTGQKENYDVFSYYKSILIIITAVSCLFIVFTSKLEGEDFKVYRLFGILMGAYATGVILSTLMAKSKEIAMWGFLDRYEGMFVLLSYLILFATAALIIRTEYDMKLVIKALLVSATVISLIGLFQFFGEDLWRSSIGKFFLLGSNYSSYSEKMKFVFQDGNIYSTLFHPDYVGSYMAMLVTLVFALWINEKSVRSRVILSFVLLLIAFNWLGCNSRAGLLGGIVGIGTVLLSSLRKVKNWRKLFIGILATGLVLLIIVNVSSGGYFSKRFQLLLNDIKEISAGESISQPYNPSIPLRNIAIKENQLTLDLDSNRRIIIAMEKNKLGFYDGSNYPLKVNFDSGNVRFQDSKYKDVNFTIKGSDSSNVLQLIVPDLMLNFLLTTNKITLLDNKGKSLDIKPVQRFGFEGLETIGSSRGYIWSRSLPLLKHTLIWGYGPDEFVLYFPQYDVVGKLLAYGDPWMVVDKVHDLYLQTALNTGVVSLLALIFLFGTYIVKSIKIYSKINTSSSTMILGLGIFASICAYLVSAFFNDSVVSVAPVFWILLGLGIKINTSVNQLKS